MVFTFLIYIFIDWIVHIFTVNSLVNVSGWANYKIFIKEFNKYNWTNEYFYGECSLYCMENNCRFDDGIVYFNNIGMKMITPIDWLLVRLYIKNYVKSNKLTKKPIKVKYNWYKNIYS